MCKMAERDEQVCGQKTDVPEFDIFSCCQHDHRYDDTCLAVCRAKLVREEIALTAEMAEQWSTWRH